MRLKTDSFVVESNVHFPTDYNLLWDSSRKCIDIIGKFLCKYQDIPGWRKLACWYRGLRNAMRALAQVGKAGGKNNESTFSTFGLVLRNLVIHDGLNRLYDPPVYRSGHFGDEQMVVCSSFHHFGSMGINHCSFR